MTRRMVGDVEIPSLVEAIGKPSIMGVDLTPRQRELLQQVEQGFLLHVWALGRRSGKTLLAVLIALYFATLRPDMARYVRRRERRYCVAVATNLRQARIFIEQAASVVEGSAFLQGFVEKITDEGIDFANYTSLRAFPATARGGRGWAVQCLLMDEAAHMLDTEGNQAAEPIFRSLVPSVSQFGEDGRVIVASSPFGTDGFFADLFHKVERGELDNAVAERGSTLEMRPGFEMAALELERQRDPDGFAAEYGGEFIPAGAGFLDPLLVVAHRERELGPGEVAHPVGAIDLGFLHDATALCIVGRDVDVPRRLRLALARAWRPDLGPLGFGPTLDEIADVCIDYGVRRIYTDQHHAVAAVEHLARRGLHATVVPTTPQSKSDMFLDLKTRLYNGELELYDHAELLGELRRIETVTTPGAATVRIRRLGTSHGDIATAVALACSRIRGSGRPMTAHVPRGRIKPTITGRGATTYAERKLADALAAIRLDPTTDAALAAVGIAQKGDHQL
jgi:hypothetical protein